MTNRGMHTLLRICVALALILQSLIPAAYAIAEKSGHNVSAFICNPSQKAPSIEAQEHIETLLALLNEHPSEAPSDTHNEHCSNCVIELNSLLTPTFISGTSSNFEFPATQYFQTLLLSSKSIRGPPLGGRAPPVFF